VPRSYSKHAAWSNRAYCPFSKEVGAAGIQFKTHVQKNGIFAFIKIGKVARGKGIRIAEARSDHETAKREEQRTGWCDPHVSGTTFPGADRSSVRARTALSCVRQADRSVPAQEAYRCVKLFVGRFDYLHQRVRR
jgi:hypothetical protein